MNGQWSMVNDPCYIEVAIPVGIRKTFAYSVPAEFKGRIGLGMRVLAPFGTKLVTGYVVGVLNQAPPGSFKVRAIRQLFESDPVISESLVETALWVSENYFAPPGEVFRAIFPAGTQVSGERKISLTPKAAMLLHGGLRPAGLKPQEDLLLDILAREDSMTARDLCAKCGIRGAEAWIESLTTAGLIAVDIAVEQPKVKAKEQLGIRILPDKSDLLETLTPAQRKFCSALIPGAEPVPLPELLRFSKSSYSMARVLEKKGAVEIAPLRIHRDLIELAETQPAKELVLTPAQNDLVNRLSGIIRRKKAARCLIHGVTGSGKTEVYLRMITEALKLGGTAIFLVPEIGLTPLLSRLVVSRFPGLVSLLHSGMSAGERYDQWIRIYEGRSRVVVGTRSAVFAPLRDVKLVVIDEEQDSSYKQDESPRYHAREVAWHRVQQSNGVLLTGSATPSIESFYMAAQAVETHCFRLPERVESRPMPRVTIVDMTQEFKRHGKNITISAALQKELENCMDRGEQAIVLLNRRGFSRTLLCRSCGHIFECSDCSVSMTYHQQDNRLACHYCGQERRVPEVCANCGGPYIHYSGVGTEQLEAMVKSLLPKARIARLDRDSVRKKGVMRSTLFQFAARELDILVGTQMLAKGHDFPDVTMVGVVAADSGLSFPDFRAAERTFQLLTQVAGRAGRGVSPGHVIIQSYYPDHYALQYAQRQDFESFYKREIEFRRHMGYPPFRNLIQILITDPDRSKAQHAAEKIVGALRLHIGKLDADSRPVVLGPASAPLEKLRGNYRMQIIIKCKPGSNAMPMLQDCFEDLNRQKISAAKIQVDVDPQSLL
jgi:primosomal protein N' (replication factor Y) (superfamily II helicase)